MRVALRLAYDGTRFQGSQRQPDARTVDGDLVAALGRLGAVPDPQAAAFATAGRTDAGVSATGHVAAFDTAFRPDRLVRAVNAELDDAWALAWAEVADGFDPRRAAVARTYVYHAAVGPDDDTDAASAAFAAFVGEHDFSRFARVEPHRSPVRRVDVARLHPRGGVWTFTVEGPSFVWNQVRRMVAAALAVGRGDATVQDVRDGLAGKAVDLGVAPAEGLTLTDVRYPEGLVAWRTSPGDRRELQGWFRDRVGAARVVERRERLRLQAAEALDDEG